MKDIAFKDLIFYEIYPNSFKDSDGDGYGDIPGIISKLDYVAGLGFNAIWLNPCYESPFRDGGYDITDPFNVARRFGTNEDLKELFHQAHARGMKVFLDLVPGHMSTQNPRFINSGKAYTNPDSNLFIWSDNVWDAWKDAHLISGCYQRFGCYYVNFFGHQPAINYGFNKITSPSWQKPWKEVTSGREYLESIMEYWLKFGADGFRVDMADSLVKNDDKKTATIELWNIIRKDLDSKGVKKFYMTSEWSNPKQAFKAGFDSDFVLDHENNCSHYLFRQNKNRSKPLLEKYDESLYSKFVVDLNQRIRAAKRYNKQLSFISGNHDTWRIANFLKGDSLKLAYLFLFTAPGVPYVYYGDEIGMTTDASMPSIEGGYQRTGSRLPMRFDSSKNAGFSSSDTLFLPTNQSDSTVEEAVKDKESLLNLIVKLIKLRKEESDLRSYDFSLLTSKLAYRRGKIKVFMNLLDSDQKINLSREHDCLLSIGDFYMDGLNYVLKPHAGIIIKEKDYEK